MNDVTCDYEKEAQKASLSGQFSTDLQEHIAECATCQEIVSVADLMRGLATSSEQPGELPKARYIWWKAHVLKNQIAEKRATHLVVMIRRFAYLAVAVGLVILFVCQRAEVSHELRTFTETSFSSPTSKGPSAVRFLIYLIPVMLAINILLTIRTFWNHRIVRK